MVVPQKCKIELPYNPEIPLLGMCPEELKSWSQRDIYAPMFIAALFTVAKTWKQPKCPLTDEWIKKKWYMHTIEYYSTLKRKGILKCATTRMNLEDIMLVKRASHKMTNIVWFHLYEVPGIIKFMETENRMLVARG